MQSLQDSLQAFQAVEELIAEGDEDAAEARADGSGDEFEDVVQVDGGNGEASGAAPAAAEGKPAITDLFDKPYTFKVRTRSRVLRLTVQPFFERSQEEVAVLKRRAEENEHRVLSNEGGARPRGGVSHPPQSCFAPRRSCRYSRSCRCGVRHACLRTTQRSVIPGILHELIVGADVGHRFMGSVDGDRAVDIGKLDPTLTHYVVGSGAEGRSGGGTGELIAPCSGPTRHRGAEEVRRPLVLEEKAG